MARSCSRWHGQNNRPGQRIQAKFVNGELRVTMAGRGGAGRGNGCHARPGRCGRTSARESSLRRCTRSRTTGLRRRRRWAGTVGTSSPAASTMPPCEGMADAMVSSGMKDAGYVYINIDDTWEGDARRAGQHHDQQEVPGHEGAGRLRPLQRPEARHLLLARPEDLRRLRRQLRPRRAGCARPTRRGASTT